MKRGFFTTWNLGLPGCCIWYGCTKPKVKGGFCEEHGKIEVKVKIVDDLPVNPKNPNIGFKKTY